MSKKPGPRKGPTATRQYRAALLALLRQAVAHEPSFPAACEAVARLFTEPSPEVTLVEERWLRVLDARIKAEMGGDDTV